MTGPWEQYQAPAAEAGPWAAYGGAAPPPTAPAPLAVPGTGMQVPGPRPDTPKMQPSEMEQRVAREKAAPPSFAQKIVGAVEAGLNVVSSITNFLPGLASGALQAGASAVGQGVGAATTALDRRARGVPATLPGDPKVGAGGEEVIARGLGAAMYQPKTDVGKSIVEEVVMPVVSQLPALAGHEGMVRQPTGVAPAVRAVGDVARASGAAARQATGKVAAKALGLDPELAKVAQIAGSLKYPIDVRPDQVVKNAKFTKLAGQAASDVPMAGSKNVSNHEAFTRNLIDLLNPEETGDRLSPDVFHKAMERSGEGIGDIMARTPVPVADLDDGLRRLSVDAEKFATDSDKRIVGNYVSELLSKADEQGVIDGTALKELNSEIGIRARAEAGNDLGRRLNDLQGEIQDVVNRNVRDPADAAALTEFRRQYAYGKILEPDVAKTINGLASPARLMQAITNTKLGKHLMANAKGGPIGDLAKVGQLVKEPASSNTAERHLVYRAIGDVGKAAAAAAGGYPAALAYNTLGPKLTRAMIGKRPTKGPPPKEPPPELTTSPGAGGPRGGGEPPKPGPLGDLTPDWETTPGAAGPREHGMDAAGLTPAVGEPPITTGNRKSKLEIPSVPGRPDLPDTLVTGRPAETAATDRAIAAMDEPGTIEARRRWNDRGSGGGGQPPSPEKGGGPVIPKLPVGEVREGQPKIKTEATGRIPVGKVIEGEPKTKPFVPKKIPVGEATEIVPERIEPDEPIPAGEAVEASPEQVAAWRKEFGLGEAEATRADAVVQALKKDAEAVERAAVQHENSPRAFDREIERINTEAVASDTVTPSSKETPVESNKGPSPRLAEVQQSVTRGEAVQRISKGEYDALTAAREPKPTPNAKVREEYFTGSANNKDEVSIYRAVGALGREQVWKGPVKELGAKLRELREGETRAQETKPAAEGSKDASESDGTPASPAATQRPRPDGDATPVAGGNKAAAGRPAPDGRVTDGDHPKPDDKPGAVRQETGREVPPADKGDEEVFSAEKVETFYSPLTRAVEGLKQSKAPAGDWSNMLRGLTSKGVTASEIEWSGVGDWLKAQEGRSVPKAEVVDFLNKGGVKVEEVVKGRDGKPNNDVWEPDDGLTGNTKFGQHQLPGGTNYREVLLTLPDESYDSFERLKKAAHDAYNEHGAESDIYKKLARRVDGMLARQGDEKPSFKSTHWDEPNVLAHIRLNDRTDANGKRVLFVEEIQSDWGQTSKKSGFDRKVFTVSVGGNQRGHFETRAEAEQALKDKPLLQGGTIKEVPSGGPPAAPFVGKTDAWTALALKRVIKMAADEGYDRVAFINGEQSAARYDLSKQVDRIEVVGRTDARTGEKTRSVGIALKDDGAFVRLGVDANGIVDNVSGAQDITDAKGKPLADVIGKEMAERVMKADLGTLRGGVEFKGEGLKVGGEGMHTFYDKIVPNVAKDVLRKLGGGGLTTVDVRSKLDTGDGWRVGEVSMQQPGFDITPALREKVAGGVPLFKDTAPQGKPVGSPEALDGILRAKFGDKLIQGLQDQGILKYALARDEGQVGDRGRVKAVLRKGREATLYFDRLTPEQAPAALLHELGEHFGIVRMLGQERYGVVLNELRALRNTPEVREAWDHVKKHYIGEGTAAKLKGTDDPTFLREVAAKLVEEHPDLPFVRRLINEIRAFLYEHFGTTLGNRVDANLIRGMAASALRKASKGQLPAAAPARVYRPFVPSSGGDTAPRPTVQ